MLLIIESGLRSAAAVGHPSPVLVAVVVMPQPTPSRSMLATYKWWTFASSEPDALWSVDSSASLLPTSAFFLLPILPFNFASYHIAKPTVKVNILVLKNVSTCQSSPVALAKLVWKGKELLEIVRELFEGRVWQCIIVLFAPLHLDLEPLVVLIYFVPCFLFCCLLERILPEFD